MTDASDGRDYSEAELKQAQDWQAELDRLNAPAQPATDGTQQS